MTEGDCIQAADMDQLGLEWRTEALYVGRGHYRAADLMSWRHRLLGVASTVLSAGVGTYLLYVVQQLRETPLTATQGVFLAGLSLVASAVTGLQAFMGYDERSRQHQSAGAAYF